MSPSKSGSAPNSPNTSFDSVDSAPPPAGSFLHSYTSASFPGGGPYASTPYATANGGGLRNGGPTSPMKGRGPPVPVGVLKTRKRSGGGQPFDPEATPSRLNFTYRRELEKQQHEKQLVDNLRTVSGLPGEGTPPFALFALKAPRSVH